MMLSKMVSTTASDSLRGSSVTRVDLFDEVRLGHRMFFVFVLSRSFCHRMRASSRD